MWNHKDFWVKTSPFLLSWVRKDLQNAWKKTPFPVKFRTMMRRQPIKLWHYRGHIQTLQDYSKEDKQSGNFGWTLSKHACRELCTLQYTLQSVYRMQGPHTSQMRKFKGISSVIKRSPAHFQMYTYIRLLYVYKTSSNFSHLFQDFCWSMQHSKEVSIIFLKNGWWQNRVKFREKKNICADLFFVSFTNGKGIQGFYTKCQTISRVQWAKINARLFMKSLEYWVGCREV